MKITDVIGHAGPRQKEPFKLVILNERLQPTSNAKAGEHGFLEVQWHSVQGIRNPVVQELPRERMTKAISTMPLFVDSASEPSKHSDTVVCYTPCLARM
ncbi:hypothetical protein D918_09616 [Trichuris suis]|nr:hypothetical protein D918_09616 [Trichuris suis]